MKFQAFFKTSPKKLSFIIFFVGKTEVFIDYIAGSAGNDTCFTYPKIVRSRSEPRFVRDRCKMKQEKKISRKTHLKFF